MTTPTDKAVDDESIDSIDGNVDAADAEYPWRNEDWLRARYIGDDMTQKEIANHLGCSTTTIYRWFKRHDIETSCGIDRKGTVQSVADLPEADYDDEVLAENPWRDPRKLFELHVEEDLSVLEVATRLGCAERTVQRYLGEYGIMRTT